MNLRDLMFQPIQVNDYLVLDVKIDNEHNLRTLVAIVITKDDRDEWDANTKHCIDLKHCFNWLSTGPIKTSLEHLKDKVIRIAKIESTENIVAPDIVTWKLYSKVDYDFLYNLKSKGDLTCDEIACLFNSRNFLQHPHYTINYNYPVNGYYRITGIIYGTEVPENQKLFTANYHPFIPDFSKECKVEINLKPLLNAGSIGPKEIIYLELLIGKTLLINSIESQYYINAKRSYIKVDWDILSENFDQSASASKQSEIREPEKDSEEYTEEMLRLAEDEQLEFEINNALEAILLTSEQEEALLSATDIDEFISILLNTEGRFGEEYPYIN